MRSVVFTARRKQMGTKYHFPSQSSASKTHRCTFPPMIQLQKLYKATLTGFQEKCRHADLHPIQPSPFGMWSTERCGQYCRHMHMYSKYISYLRQGHLKLHLRTSYIWKHLVKKHKGNCFTGLPNGAEEELTKTTSVLSFQLQLVLQKPLQLHYVTRQNICSQQIFRIFFSFYCTTQTIVNA